jgi:hypothetical protein
VEYDAFGFGTGGSDDPLHRFQIRLAAKGECLMMDGEETVAAGVVSHAVARHLTIGIQEKSMPDFDGRTFTCCKTAFRPYDVAVCAVLLIAKRHLGTRISVRTDGDDAQWFAAKMLCQTVLGYGIEYAVTDGELLPVDPGDESHA